jgi:hypothetical protein
MRKLIAALLAAATLTTPAMAQRGRDPGGGGFQAAPERTVAQERRAERSSAQAQRREAPRQQVRQEARQDRQAFRQERREDRQDFRQERRDDRRDWRQGDYANRQQFRRDRADDVRDFRRDRAEDRRDFRQDRQQDRREWQRDRQDWQRDRNQWQNRDRDGSRWNNRGGWSRDWRRDSRYNWQQWRQTHRGSYRFPRDYAPRGWSHGYNRFSLGVILSAPLFSQSYWIDDPFQYSLPPAYGPYRWVRYYDDALLVDVRTGEVVDAVYDFFW